MTPTKTVSIVIPTLNEMRTIGATLDSLKCFSRSAEVLVVDGGSDDQTTDIARAHGVRVIASERGRGLQMHKGACAAEGVVLWFLHADTIVPHDSIALILATLRDPEVLAGNFEVRFAGNGQAARFMTWLYPKLRRLGLCYGDSAIFVRREVYEQIRGFKPFPIFEDLDLVRNLRKVGGFVHIPTRVVTSSRRFQERSFLYTFALWVTMQVLYWAGVSPHTMARFYAPLRDLRKGA